MSHMTLGWCSSSLVCFIVIKETDSYVVSIDIVETVSHNAVLVEFILLKKSTWRTRDTTIISITCTERTHFNTEVKGIPVTSWIPFITFLTYAICKKYYVRINRCPISLMIIIFNPWARICLKSQKQT